MKISQVIQKLQELKNQYGDLECKTLDTYTETEGWDLDFLDEYDNVSPRYTEIVNEDNPDEIAKFILL